MSAPSLDPYAEAFERLRGLPPDERAAALAALALPEDDRAILRRLLDADAGADEDDPLARAVGSGAARLATPRSDRLGPYRLIRELGAGGMGTVFLAERVDGGFTQQIAIKLLRGFPTADGLRRLRQERQILASLDHPHIARLLDGGETADGQPWLALEYIDGLPLLDYAARHAPRLADRLALFDAVLDAVGHAHQRLVIHRDIKPANVLVNAAGEVKLLDFGIARLFELDAGEPARETSTRVFSAGYASPEQREGRVVTTASDLYSLGVLLRELVAGRAHAPHRPPSLPLDAELGGIIAKASDDDPAKRYASAGEFRDDLDRYRDGRPVRAARMTRAYRLRKFVGRHRLGVALAALATVALGLFVWRLDHERERAVAAEVAMQQALARSERDAARARAALAFLTDAFSAAAPGNALSKTVSVRELLDKAKANLHAGTFDPAITSSMQRLLGRLYDSLGDKQTATELLQRGLEGAQPEDRAQALELALDFDQLANLLGMVDRAAEAREAIDQAKWLRDRFAPDDAVAQAWSELSLGVWHANAGEGTKAIALLRDVLASSARGTPLPAELEIRAAAFLAAQLTGNAGCADAIATADRGLQRTAGGSALNPDRLWLLRTRASALRACARPAEAETVLRELMVAQERIVGRDSMQMLQLTNELSLTLKEQGRYREAAALLESMHLPEGESPYNRGVVLVNLATTLEEVGDYPRALKLIGKARERFEEAELDADNQGRRTLGRIEARALALNGRSAKAIAMLEDLRARARRIDGADSGEYANVTWQLAFAQALAGDAQAALALVDEAERAWRKLLPERHRNFANAHRLRAELALARGEPQAADAELAAAQAILEAISAPPSDLAAVQAELAGVRLAQGRRDEAKALLEPALARLRDAFLPAQIWRAAAEHSAARLGIP